MPIGKADPQIAESYSRCRPTADVQTFAFKLQLSRRKDSKGLRLLWKGGADWKVFQKPDNHLLCEEYGTDLLGTNMHRDIDSKVIGYFAFCSPTEVICDGDACVISGSEQGIRNYITSVSPESAQKTTIKKTRFGEIINGMKLGAPYAFDEQSYNRFYPLANKIGFNLKEEDFSIETETGYHFVVIRP